MKLTDLSIIFVIILLPFIMIVYVNTSFVIKAEKEEMYYKKVIDSALRDATDQMKQIENSDITIDYGYSGIYRFDYGAVSGKTRSLFRHGIHGKSCVD